MTAGGSRKQWGTLTNVSRAFSYKLNAMLDVDDKVNRSFFRRQSPYSQRHYTIFKIGLHKFMLDENEHPELKALDNKKHGPNQVSTMIFHKINDLYKRGTISGDQLIILNEEIITMTHVCGACERIKNTPIPLAYSAFIKKFIIFYTMTLPVGYVFHRLLCCDCCTIYLICFSIS
jgi:putative membrane protein